MDQDCRLDDSVQLKPLWVLSLGTLDRFGNFLNNLKTLRTEEPDRQLRDWRGLQDQANLSLEQRERVKASKNKAGEIISIWSRRPGDQAITIGQLWRALTRMERHDVQRELQKQILRDCEGVKNLNFQSGEDVALLTRRGDLLTVQDVQIAQGDQGAQQSTELPQIDALVLYGQEDERFVEYLVERMEKIGLKVFFPPRDLRAGMIEHATRADIIAKRCKKVVAVISPSFCQDNKNIHDVDITTIIYLKNRQRILLPVVYTRKRFDMPPNLEGLWKLAYRPERTLINFWDQLIKSFENEKLLKGLKAEDKKMDFPSPPDETGAPTQQANSSTAHTPFLSTAATAGSSTSTIDDTSNGPSIFNTQSSTVSQFSTTSSQAALMGAPSPPNHEPGKMKQAYRSLKNKFKKTSDKYKAPPEPGS